MSYTKYEITDVTLVGKDGNADLTVSGAEAGPLYEAHQAYVAGGGSKLFILSTGETVNFDCYCGATPTRAATVVTPVCDPIPCAEDVA
jgi:hypothetical protein